MPMCGTQGRHASGVAAWTQSVIKHKVSGDHGRSNRCHRFNFPNSRVRSTRSRSASLCTQEQSAKLRFGFSTAKTLCWSIACSRLDLFSHAVGDFAHSEQSAEMIEVSRDRTRSRGDIIPGQVSRFSTYQPDMPRIVSRTHWNRQDEAIYRVRTSRSRPLLHGTLDLACISFRCLHAAPDGTAEKHYTRQQPSPTKSC